MPEFLFYFFSALTLLAALFVVINRNAVNSAMCMILALLGVAALFLLLQAYFLAVLQVVVYAGAVMVLFLFIIMLLGAEERTRPRLTWPNLAAGVAALLALAAGALWLADKYPVAAAPAAVPDLPTGTDPLAYAAAAKTFGFGLFTRYLLPFEVAGFLLLIAMVGVVVLSKRTPPNAHDDPNPPTPF